MDRGNVCITSRCHFKMIKIANFVMYVLLSHVQLCWPHGLQHTRLPCPSLSPGVCSNSCPLSRWCYLTISSSVPLFSFCLRSSPASASFPMSPLFTSGGQSIGASASASALPMNIQGWFPLGFTGLISLLFKHCGHSVISREIATHTGHSVISRRIQTQKGGCELCLCWSKVS